MFDINIKFKDITISDIESEDIDEVKEWFKVKNYNMRDLKEVFLENYISENDFFLKICRENFLLGIIKGRIEFKNPDEVWFWYYSVKEIEAKSIILNKIIRFFYDSYGINIFFAVETENNKGSIDFWNKNNFKFFRLSKDFFDIDGELKNMIILKLENM